MLAKTNINGKLVQFAWWTLATVVFGLVFAIRIRLLVGATFSTVRRKECIACELPINVVGSGDNCLSSLTSRLRRNVSSALLATSTKRSALNGFSMKS